MVDKRNNNTKTYVCKRRYLYNGLTKMGFKPYKVAPDMYDCERLVWLYDDTDELRKAIEEISSVRASDEHAQAEPHSL